MINFKKILQDKLKSQKTRFENWTRGAPPPRISTNQLDKHLAAWKDLSLWRLSHQVVQAYYSGIFIQDRSLQQLNHIFASRLPGVDMASLASAWINSLQTYYRFQPLIFFFNLHLVLDLESLRPGSVKFLSEKFGIRVFARYPLPLLVRQYDRHNDSLNPYVALISLSRDDHNGALYSCLFSGYCLYWRRRQFNTLIVEVGSPLEAAKRLVYLYHHYGPISAAVVTVHGHVNSLDLDRSKYRYHTYEITLEDLNRPIFAELKKLFVPNPSLVLVSCSTGQAGGMAQKLSEIGATVSAPDRPTNIFFLKTKTTPSGISLRPFFQSRRKTRRTYFNGQLIDN